MNNFGKDIVVIIVKTAIGIIAGHYTKKGLDALDNKIK